MEVHLIFQNILTSEFSSFFTIQIDYEPET